MSPQVVAIHGDILSQLTSCKKHPRVFDKCDQYRDTYLLAFVMTTSCLHFGSR